MRFNRIFLLLFCMLFLTACGRVSATDTAAIPEGLTHTATAKDSDFINSLTFLGDSTTAHMLTRAPLQEGKHSKQIWAAKNRYLNLGSRITYEKIVCPESGEELTIAEMAKKWQPRYLVITLGIDYGVYYYRNDLKTFAFYYEKLLDAVCEASPDTVLVLQSIFPVGRGSTVITNEMVNSANAVIAEIAARRGLVFVDAATPLKDSEGYLAPEYCYSEDGIHLTSAAYDVIFKNLIGHAQEIKGEA